MPENNIKAIPTNLVSKPNVDVSDSKSQISLNNKKEISEASLPPKVEPNTIYFPKNNWQLNSYQENGVEFIVPLQVNATITFSNRSASQTYWTTNVFFLDVNGNISNNSYNGRITFINNGYTISFLGSTALIFEPELNIPLELKIENSGILHMSYISRSGEVIVHWQQ